MNAENTAYAFQIRKLLIFVVAILFPLLIFLVPTNQDFTPQLRTYFVITFFIIILMATELVPLFVSALALGTLYFLSGIADIQTAFGYWTSTIVWMILGGLILSTILEQCGLLARIAYLIICKCGGSFNGAVIGSFLVGIALNLVTFCNGWIVACVLVYGLCKAMGLERSHQAGLICLAGALGANGSVIYLYHPGYIALIDSSLQSQISPDMMVGLFTPFSYLGWAIPCCLLTIFTFMRVYNTSDLKDKFNKAIFEKKLSDLGKMSYQEKLALGFVTVLIVYLISCQFTKLPPAYGFMSIPYLMFLPGLELGNAETIKRTNLASIFFIGACLGIGIVGAKVGFGNFLTKLSVPLLQGYGKLAICLFFLAIGIVANILMTPFAMLSCLVIPFLQIASTLGVNPMGASFILQYATDLVFFPHEAAGLMIMYSYGMWPMKDFIIQNTVKTTINVAFFICLMYPVMSYFGMI